MFAFWEKRYWSKWSVVIISLLTVSLRVPLLTGSFWLDEAAQALESARPWSQQFLISKDFQPPLYHLLVRVLITFGQAEWWLRLASLLPALGASWLFMSIVDRRWRERASYAVGLLLASSSLMVYFSQELRPYMLAVFFAALSWWAYDRWLWEPQKSASSKKLAALFVLSLLGGYFSSYVFFFWPLGFIGATLIWRRKSSVSFFKALVVSGLGFLPWVGALWQQLQVGSTLRQNLPGWDQVVSTPMLKALPLLAAKFLLGVQTVDLTWRDGLLIAVPYTVLAVSLGYTLWQARHKPERSEFWQSFGLLVCLFAIPLFTVWLASAITPVLAPKRVLFLLPVLFAFIGWLMRYNPKWGVLTLALFFIWQSASLLQYWTNPLLQREDWRSLIADIDSRFSAENTSVVMGFNEPFAPWVWYHHQNFLTVTTGIKPLPDLDTANQVLTPTKHDQHVLVFDYLRDLTDPFRLTETSLQQSGFKELGTIDTPLIGFVRVYTQNHLYAERWP